MSIAVNSSWSFVYWVMNLMFMFVTPYVLLYYVRIAILHTLVAGLLARSRYSEGPATGHLDTGFFLVSLYLKANAEMVPKIPSCHYMLLMWPSRLRFISNQFHIYVHV